MKKWLYSTLLTLMLVFSNVENPLQPRTVLCRDRIELSTFEVANRVKYLLLRKIVNSNLNSGRIIEPDADNITSMKNNVLAEVLSIDKQLRDMFVTLHNMWKILRDARIAS